jgi:hypothetical protein
VHNMPSMAHWLCCLPSMLQGCITLDYDHTYLHYKLSGKWDKPHPHLLRITELPIGLWT